MTRNVAQNTRPSFRFLGEVSWDETIPGSPRVFISCSGEPGNKAICTLVYDRPVARIFRRGVTWTSNLHKLTRLGCLGACSPRKVLEIRCSEIDSEVILGQKHSHTSYLASRVLHPCMHLLSQLTSNFPDRRY